MECLNVKLPKISSFLKWLINAALFYLGWLVCMYQAVGDSPYLGPLFVLFVLVYHFLMTPLKSADLILCSTCILTGTIVDSLYINVGMLSFKGGYHHYSFLAPLWVTSLWGLYAISINHSLKWLNCNLLLAAMMGAGGAISSYLAGVKLEAVSLNWQKEICFAIIGAIWAVVVPLSLIYAAWLEQRLPEQLTFKTNKPV